MSQELQLGLRKFVENEISLKQLFLSWFGGEPLVAKEVVLENTRYFKKHCDRAGIEFSCAATTNGYLLEPDLADQLIPAGLSFLQVTLDGISEEHDKRRILQDGGATFERIWNNLSYLSSTDYEFTVWIRHNFDPGSIPRLAEFLDMIGDKFSSDSRFGLELAPIGTWGGPNDSELNTFDVKDGIAAIKQAKRLALERRIPDPLTFRSMQPNGNMCYAANPRSFVVGADGRLYKCTVELDYHDRNIVGQLHPDGSMDLDWRKMALWCETDGMSEGKKCNSCYFAPTCHGAACPKEWMDENDCTCPSAKQMIRDTLTFIREEQLFSRFQRNGLASCTR